ncbi:hypothetical protein [Methanoplanus endosymbiosus]|uniref:Uncharacterized protein n=1 Tax=Methanoplanus endosymbiosus TaxID=33865 RepID=A0A9E7PN05_9EURY|nr:hypothetical protein [Methanoplanus endosymbiosus]UUX93244.1 hypothetical protein L6E24_03725 [Methanoplanus endosymbiosus]
MLVKVKKPDGTAATIEMKDTMWLEIGDHLPDGSVVIELKYPDDIDDDMEALDLY